MEWELIESEVTQNEYCNYIRKKSKTDIMMVLTEPLISLQQGSHITLDRPCLLSSLLAPDFCFGFPFELISPCISNCIRVLQTLSLKLHTWLNFSVKHLTKCLANETFCSARVSLSIIVYSSNYRWPYLHSSMQSSMELQMHVWVVLPDGPNKNTKITWEKTKLTTNPNYTCHEEQFIADNLYYILCFTLDKF